MENNIMVSVICNTYNHEKFIEFALKGFISQKTNFKIEVLIHDDASTDGTADIIREYEKKYPDIIKPIYQSENQFSKKLSISKNFQYPRAKGKYIAFCEGDDCWIDENKLQKQVDFLENHPNCVMTCHNSLRKNYRTGKETTENPIDKSGYATAHDILVGKPGLWIATASLVYRKDILETYPEWFRTLPIGDMPLRWYYFAMGDVYYFEEVMSIYNYQVPGSWSASRSSIKQFDCYIKFYDKYNEFTNYKYDNYIKKEKEHCKFREAVVNKRYLELKRPEYADLFRQIPFKDRLYLYLYQYMPFILNSYSKIKTKLRSK